MSSSINDIRGLSGFWFFNESAGDCFNETEATQTQTSVLRLACQYISPKYGVLLAVSLRFSA